MIATAQVPFTAVVGQENVKTALLLNAVNPAIGGVLISGSKGTAKSTLVRGLAALLPEIDVVAQCRFNCAPAPVSSLCFECLDRLEAGEQLHSASRRMRVVELPLNATEDRVVGTLDIEHAITAGERRFDPGVLAKANRNILYVDEVNLLDDHIVDMLLDAAAMGANVVEREGVSLQHPSRFILIGTMNPEEGDLRPQLLDRFGLWVSATGLPEVADRVAVMEREHRTTHDRSGLHAHAMGDQDRLASIIALAQDMLPLVSLDARMRQLIAMICLDAATTGHRADIVVARTARTICAWREAEAAVAHHLTGVERERPADALQVGIEDVIAAAELALPHRRQEKPKQGSDAAPSVADKARERAEQIAQEALSNVQAATTEAETTSDASAEEGEAGEGSGGNAGQSPSSASEQDAKAQNPQAAEDLFQVRSIHLPRDRKMRRNSGRRNRTTSGDKRGRYVRSRQQEHVTDVAFDATMRAAAPHQIRRRAEAVAAGVAAHALQLDKQDLRQKIRQRKTGTLIVFVVDASASMDAEQRMQATKGAVLSLLRDAYVRRDKVSLVVFSGRSARVVLHPTGSVDLAQNRLQRLGVGGTTPLTHGLVAGLKVIRNERLKDSAVIPLMVLISDGRGNISLFGDEPLLEAQMVAAQIGAEHVRMLIIDSARDFTATAMPGTASLPRLPGGASLFGSYGFNACQDLADRSGGEYLGLFDLSQGAIVAGVERTLRRR